VNNVAVCMIWEGFLLLLPETVYGQGYGLPEREYLQ